MALALELAKALAHCLCVTAACPVGFLVEQRKTRGRGEAGNLSSPHPTPFFFSGDDGGGIVVLRKGERMKAAERITAASPPS